MKVKPQSQVNILNSACPNTYVNNGGLNCHCVQVRGEMEQKMAQAQSMAVQEALKEANAQSNSKEVVHAYVRTP